MMVCLVLVASTGVSSVMADSNRVEFEITDEAGPWFKSTVGPIAGTQSLAVATPEAEVRFTGKSNTVHTRTSLIFPTGATNMPFDTPPRKGSDTVVLHTPGLDLGEQITLVNGITVPTSSDLATRLLRTFFIATNPANWQDYTSAAPWLIKRNCVSRRSNTVDITAHRT